MSDRPNRPEPNHAHERFWSSLDGTPGEILWEADAGDLQDDVGHFAAAFGQRLPVVDLGCGDGRQTRFLARHCDFGASSAMSATIAPAAGPVNEIVKDHRSAAQPEKTSTTTVL